MVNRPASGSTPERLAYWYLRLNGFLLLENFVLHPDRGTQQRTDADLLGVRFKHRRELLMDPMEDDPPISDSPAYCNVIIAEVKRGQCALNGPWTNPGSKNIHRVLRAIGCFGKDKDAQAASALYGEGHYLDDDTSCRLIAIGNSRGNMPIQNIPQFLFEDLIQFIHGRFRKYLHQKASVGSWTPDGQRLREMAERHSTLPPFETEVRQYFDLPMRRTEDRA